MCAVVLDEHVYLSAPAPAAVETVVDDPVPPWRRSGQNVVDAVATNEIEVVDLTSADWARCRDLIVQYADLRLGLVDVPVVAVAERSKITTVATLNRRDFAAVRPTHCEALTLVP